MSAALTVLTTTSADELPKAIERKRCQYKSCGNTDLELKEIERFVPAGDDLYRREAVYEDVRITNGDTQDVWKRMITPERIDILAPDEVFVFGSNADGAHAGGAVHTAVTRFGAAPLFLGAPDDVALPASFIAVLDSSNETMSGVRRGRIS